MFLSDMAKSCFPRFDQVSPRVWNKNYRNSLNFKNCLGARYQEKKRLKTVRRSGMGIWQIDKSLSTSNKFCRYGYLAVSGGRKGVIFVSVVPGVASAIQGISGAQLAVPGRWLPQRAKRANLYPGVASRSYVCTYYSTKCCRGAGFYSERSERT